MLRSKIAFLYSNKQLLDIYTSDAIEFLSDKYEIDSSLSFYEKSHELVIRIKNENFWEETDKYWKEYDSQEVHSASSIDLEEI